MDPKTKRIDPGNPAECERLIERGHLVLIAIASEAHAARVEAQQAELEVALSEARGGDASMLRNWLSNYHGNSESLSVASNPVTASRVSVTTTRTSFPSADSGVASCPPAKWPPDNASREESREPTKSWDRLLPEARERLELRSNRIHESDCEAASNSISQTTEISSTEVEDDLREDDLGEIGQFEHKSEIADDELPQEELADELDSDEPLVFQDLPELQVWTEADRDLGNPSFRSGTRGLIVSVVVHLVLIGTLMAITMRIPEQTASLGFEAGSTEGFEDSIEVLQPIEITAPNEMTPEMPSETAESSLSLPSAVGLASTSLSAASTTAASNMSGVQASANRAVAAAPGRPNPSHANASFFGAGASGNCFCYVIDGSESMRGGPWEAAKAELLRSLGTMKESHRFYVIFFNQKLNAITMPGEKEPASSPLYATAENVKHAWNWIESLRIERGAPPNDALLHAIELEPDAIYLLADGATKIDVPAFLRAKNRTNDFISGEQVRVPIHAIAFYSPESGQKLMKQVATENKGQFIYVPDPRKK